MKDKELRKLIGSRIKQRRLELNLTQPYVAEKMGVLPLLQSCVMRMVRLTIRKKWCWKVFRKHSMYLWNGSKGKQMNMKPTLRIRENYRFVMRWEILEQLPLALTKEEDAFSKDLLLLMLKQYGLFLDSFQFACKNFKGNAGQTDIAKTIGFESNEEYNEIMFLREITPTINALNEMADVVRLYSKKPKTAEQRLANLLSEVLYEDSESV